jgi:nucleotide-binding universal stress UspA family protein
MLAHIRKGFDKMLMGSTSERVVKHAKCPVLIYKTRP